MKSRRSVSPSTATTSAPSTACSHRKGSRACRRSVCPLAVRALPPPTGLDPADDLPGLAPTVARGDRQVGRADAAADQRHRGDRLRLRPHASRVASKRAREPRADPCARLRRALPPDLSYYLSYREAGFASTVVAQHADRAHATPPTTRCPRFRPCVRAIELRGLPPRADAGGPGRLPRRGARAGERAAGGPARRRREPRLDARPVPARGRDPAADALPREGRAVEGAAVSAGGSAPSRRSPCTVGAATSPRSGPRSRRSRRARWSASSRRVAWGAKAPGSAARPGWRSRPGRRSCRCGCSARGRRSGGARIAFPPLAALIGEPIAVERTEPTAELARELTDRLQAAVESLGT